MSSWMCGLDVAAYFCPTETDVKCPGLAGESGGSDTQNPLVGNNDAMKTLIMEYYPADEYH